MSRQIINIGTNENDGTGDRLRDAMKKINENLLELYTRTGGDIIEGNLISINGNVISCVGNLTITTYGTGNINLDDPVYITKNLRINTTDLNPNINLLVNGNALIKGNTTLGDNPDADKLVLNSTVTGSIVPSLDTFYDLGSTGLRWRNIYGDTIYVNAFATANAYITGGTIDNTRIGSTTPVEGRFSPLRSPNDSFLGNLLIRDTTIYSINTNDDINLSPDGTGDVVVTADMVVAGNLTVNGTTTTVNSTAVTINDLTLTLADGAANALAANGAGLIIDGADASLTYNSTSNSWVFDRQVTFPSTDVAPFFVNSTVEVANLRVATATTAITVTASSQPNITSLGNLTTLTVDGNINLGGILVGDKTLIPYIIDGGGDPITNGSKKYLGPMNFGGTITMATLLADQPGAMTIEVRKCTYADFDGGVTHPAGSDKISASAPLTLLSSAKSQDSTLTGWTKTFSEGDIFEFVVTSSNATITWVEVAFAVTKG